MHSLSIRRTLQVTVLTIVFWLPPWIMPIAQAQQSLSSIPYDSSDVPVAITDVNDLLDRIGVLYSELDADIQDCPEEFGPRPCAYISDEGSDEILAVTSLAHPTPALPGETNAGQQANQIAYISFVPLSGTTGDNSTITSWIGRVGQSYACSSNGGCWILLTTGPPAENYDFSRIIACRSNPINELSDGGCQTVAFWQNGEWHVRATSGWGTKEIAKAGGFEEERPTEALQGSDGSFVTKRIFFGTDRNKTTKKQLRKTFGPDHSGQLEMGWIDVTVPKNHKPGEIERPSLWRIFSRENPSRYMTIANIISMEDKNAITALRKRLADSQKREILLFIHGYNTAFDEAAYRAAQIAHDLQFPGIPAMYSWASDGRVLVASGNAEKKRAYENDEQDVMKAVKPLKEYLNVLAEKSGAEAVHVIAHSMGNRAFLNALKELEANDDGPLINKVILAAADVDAEVFRNEIAPRLEGIAESITVYCSEDDRALKLSSVKHGNGNRLGFKASQLDVPAWINVIDASGIDTSILGHTYFAEVARVSNDVRLLINGRTPQDRVLQTLAPNEEQRSFWKILQ